MAIRARLVAPPPKPKQIWPWHVLKHASVRAKQLLTGDRRMEAETYLSRGFSLREAIESRPTGWKSFGDLARVEQPGRLKGILVSQEYGTPFLSATQVFDIRPIPRKFLALEKMETAKDCFVDGGTILVTRSGSVGRSTLAHAPHHGVVISDDLLRVFAKDERHYGWLYAYLHAPQVRAMTIGAHYGHIIKHLETSHLDALPIPTVGDATAAGFSHRVSRILDLRNEGHRLTLEAEALFEKGLGVLKIKDWGENGFVIRASKTFLNGRRRFDASVHNPGASEIRRRLAKGGQGIVSVAEAGFDVWVPGRYKRIPAEDGVIYRDSADLLEVSPDLTKKFADCRFGDDFGGRVKSGWILMPCSGQVYGIIGTAVLATEALDDQVVSNHVIRIAPQKDPSVRVGYLLTALSHPLWGRPLIKALAFGSSVPEIDGEDLANLKFVRLKPSDESIIADLAEASAKSRAEADVLEREIAQDAAKIIDRFIAG